MKTQPKLIKKNSIRATLKDVEIPEGYTELLSKEERALLKYALAEYNIKELAKVYGQRDKVIKTELVWRLVQLGQKLAFIILFNDRIFIDWTKANQTNSTYIQGFMDCKKQVKGAVQDGLKKSGRKTE